MSGDLPSGWAWACLPDLVGSSGILTDGDWVESKDQDPEGDVRLTQLADVGDGVFRDRSARFLTSQKAADLRCTPLQRGDVLIARMPDPLGRACVFPGFAQSCVTVVDVCVVRPGVDLVSSRWLMSAVNAPQYRVAVGGLQSGSTRKRISKKNLCTIQLPVPPEKEQRRIVSAIESYFTRLDDAVASLERAQRNLERYRASVLKAAIEGRLVPTEAELARKEGRDYEPASVLLERILAERRRRWEEAELAKMRAKGKEPKSDKWKAKYKESMPPQTEGLRALPDGWSWVSIDQLLYGIDAGKNFTCDGRPPAEEEVGVVKVSAVTWGTYDEEESKTCQRNELVNPSLFVKTGDFLFSRANTLELVGACVLVTAVSRRIMLSDKILRLAFDDVLKPWILWALRSSLGRAQIEHAASGNQMSMRNVSQGKLRQIAIPLPPADECDRIIEVLNERLSIAESAGKVVHAEKIRCSRLRQSILKWAFEGKLVDQDPTDEPASILLERIRAEREARAPKKAAARKSRKKKESAK